MKIYGTGLTGLVGSRIVELLSSNYSFSSLGRGEGIDITNVSSFGSVRLPPGGYLLHMAAKTNVDECEKDRERGRAGDAWQVNVEGTRNMVELSKKTHKKIIYISTDFVFDGEKKGSYTEEDLPHPINWYAQTKYEGEKIVVESGISYIILRLAYPYRAHFSKKDFVRSILSRLQNGHGVAGVVDHIMCPTFIDDIALALDALIQNDREGIFHVVGSLALTPFDAARAIARAFGFPASLVYKTTRQEYFQGRAARPFNLTLNNDKIEALSVKMKTFEEGLEEIKKQIESSQFTVHS